MGFRVPVRGRVTVLFGGDLTGLHVAVRPPSGRTLIAINRLADLSAGEEMTEQDKEIISELLETFCSDLIEWNLEDDNGAPVQASRDGALSVDGEFMMRVVSGWAAHFAMVPKIPQTRAVKEGALTDQDLDDLAAASMMPQQQM